ncbi:Predicted arabinose efflux permease, MFS family [Nonomuraea solani]|uniref:Predicted arabinose efflux permease, MFS family n=1 Tax=Nonomuraea solani TaxID=1144553 RepID=A0A1H6EW29_9ACTN|nr:MFS transporter [Nonomuraea solani]SEH01236.1 Predicted arabinose efflux permease, MFS family [Nonomuraea solani]
MGRDFGWLWRAFAVSSLGTGLALDSLPLLAVLVLGASAAQVSWLAAAGGAAGALLAVPLGPWVEFRPKRPLMIGADVLRFLVLLTLPVAYVLDLLSHPQLLLVAVVVAVADIVFIGASGAHLRALVPEHHLTRANGRFETVRWVSTAVGPPAGGALFALLGPVATILTNAISYLLSALAIRAIAAPEPPPPAPVAGGSRRAELAEGWRAIAADRDLRLLFANAVLVSALIMAAGPPLLHLMLGELGFTPLEYGLGFGIPCLGGILGARLSAPLVRRFGQRRIMLGFGVGRSCWLVGLAFVGPGTGGLLVVMAVEMAMITCMGVFNPVLATYRLQRADRRTMARVLTTWTIGSRAAVAATTALWGVLAAFAGARTSIAVAGILLIATSALLPWRAGNGDARHS